MNSKWGFGPLAGGVWQKGGPGGGGTPRLSPAITRSEEWQERVRSHYDDLVKDGGSPWFHLAAFKQACRVAATEAAVAAASVLHSDDLKAAAIAIAVAQRNVFENPEATGTRL